MATKTKPRKRPLRNQYEWSSVEFSRREIIVWCHPKYGSGEIGIPLVAGPAEAEQLGHILLGYARAQRDKDADKRTQDRTKKRRS